MALALDAAAKVNLHLAVLGRRDDGYHEIDTVLHTLDLHDTLCAELVDASSEASGIALEVVSDLTMGLAVPGNADNLVWRAAEAFFAMADISAAVRFHLHKRIPAGGGLGGGSSDAAAALRLLNELTGQPLSAGKLHALAASLGADVPFFLVGGSQRGRGTGTELRALASAPEFHFALVLSPRGAATAAVYQNLAADLTIRSNEASIRGDLVVPDGSELAMPTGFHNDLESSALALHPELMNLRRDMESLGFPHTCMSGSGSTFFVAMQDAAECRDAMARLAPLQQRHGVELLQTKSSPTPLSESRMVRYPGSASN
jgi:4-diphosphocytidyl-2-C-methyl-D-erythritol kinase